MTTTNGNRPKVEIQLNESANLKLLKDKAYIGENGHGPYYLYSVDHDGTEKAFFATAEIHQSILESGLKTGDVFSIKKVAVPNGKKVTTNVEFAIVNKQNGTTAHVAPEDDGLQQVMEQCLRDAITVTQSVNTLPWRSEDVRGIALTMFIQRSKAH